MGNYRNAENIWLNVRWADFVSLSYDGKRIANREGLRNIIHQKLDFQAIRESEIPIYANILSAENLHIQYRKLNGKSDDYIESVLLASSSIPCFYGKTEVEGGQYLLGTAVWPTQLAVIMSQLFPLYEYENIQNFVTIELSEMKEFTSLKTAMLSGSAPSHSLG